MFAQRSNLASPSFLLMIRDVIRFGQEAPAVLRPEAAPTYASMTLGEYLQKQGYSRGFTDNYLLPMCACVWSVPNSQVGAGARCGVRWPGGGWLSWGGAWIAALGRQCSEAAWQAC